MERLEHRRNIGPEAMATVDRLYDIYKLIKKPSIKSFKDLIPDRVIRLDLKNVSRLEKKFRPGKSEEEERLTGVLERQLNELLSIWLNGEGDEHDFEVQLASDHDDYVNGVDLIINYKGKLILAIDVSIAPYHTLARKITDTLDSIYDPNGVQDSKLTSVKYPIIDGAPARGQNMIPRVVLGMDLGCVHELGLLMLEDRVDEVLRHPLQVQIINQIVKQLSAFLVYADNFASSNRKTIITALDKSYRFFSRLLDEKRKQLNIEQVPNSNRVNLDLNTILRKLAEYMQSNNVL